MCINGNREKDVASSVRSKVKHKTARIHAEILRQCLDLSILYHDMVSILVFGMIYVIKMP